MIVVDASVVVAALLAGREAAAVVGRLFGSEATLHAPHLVDIESMQAIRRLAAMKEIGAARGQEAIADLAAFPIHRYPHTDLLGRIWDLRHNISAYDATYIALAELLDAPIVTRDRRLAATPGHQVRVEIL